MIDPRVKDELDALQLAQKCLMDMLAADKIEPIQCFDRLRRLEIDKGNLQWEIDQGFHGRDEA